MASNQLIKIVNSSISYSGGNESILTNIVPLVMFINKFNVVFFSDLKKYFLFRAMQFFPFNCIPSPFFYDYPLFGIPTHFKEFFVPLPLCACFFQNTAPPLPCKGGGEIFRDSDKDNRSSFIVVSQVRRMQNFKMHALS